MGSRASGLLTRIERATSLTPTGLMAVVGGLGVALAGHRLHNVALAVLGYALLVLVVVVLLTSRRKIVVEATRGELPRRVRAGCSLAGSITLIPTRAPTPLQVEEYFPSGLWHVVRVTFPRLRKGEPVVHNYTFIAEHRGRYQVGPMIAEVTDPFGLVRRRQQLAEPIEVVVHPQTEPLLDRISSREFTDPVIRPPRSLPWPTGSEFYGMRDYQYGDDPRTIVWRAVAQHDTLLVREAEYGIADRVTVLIDTDASMYSSQARCPRFETAVRCAASVANVHLRDGFQVDLRTSAGLLCAHMRGTQSRLQMLDALADLQRGPDDLKNGLDQLLLGRRADGHLVLITASLSSADTVALRLLSQRGCSLTIVLVSTEQTDVATYDHATGLRCSVVELTDDEPFARPFRYGMGLTTR